MPKTGELSRLFGIDRTTLNYYVKTGIIRADREENQYHIYSFSDSLALAYIRYYRGLGFTTDEIRELLSVDDPGERLARIGKKQVELRIRMEKMRLQQMFLEQFYRINSFIMNSREPIRVTPKAYYFVRKSELEGDPVWEELYRMAPSVEFSPRFSPSDGMVEMPDLFMFSGVIILESWVKEFSLTPPEGSLFHPAEEKYAVSWNIPTEQPERELSHRVRELFESPPDGKKLNETFLLYLVPSHYSTKEDSFDALCFFEYGT